MFKEQLEQLLAQTPGGLAATVMGYDGIPIDAVDAPDAADAQSALIELGNLAAQAKAAADASGTGAMTDLTLTSARFTSLLTPITDEYFLGLVVALDGLSGKGRYLMRIAAPKMAQQLS
jgi:predicted regulator of Ras-like GTPase activity (Roadblock/LC7/MglB family)